MPKLVHRTPKDRRHRGSGQPIVTIIGQRVYLEGCPGAQPRDRELAGKAAKVPKRKLPAVAEIAKTRPELVTRIAAGTVTIA